MPAAVSAMAQAPSKSTAIRAKTPELASSAYAINRRSDGLDVRLVGATVSANLELP